MITELQEVVLTYEQRQLDAWKTGQKDLIPSFVRNTSMIDHQPSYHFGEIFVLRHYWESEHWEGTQFFTFGTQWPRSELRRPGTAKLAECLERLHPGKLADFRALRRDIYARRTAKGEPDLFLYHPDGKIKFIEVKKEGDHIHPWQLTCMSQIMAIFEEPVEIIYLQEQKRHRRPKTYVLDLKSFEGHEKV